MYICPIQNTDDFPNLKTFDCLLISGKDVHCANRKSMTLLKGMRDNYQNCQSIK